MNEVARALSRAFRGMLHPRMLLLALLPMLAALAVWIGLAWVYWDTWSQWLAAAIAGSSASQWLSPRTLERLVHYSALLLLILAVAPMILVTALLIAALIVMPLVVDFVAARDYPTLDKRRGGTLFGSVVNAMGATLIFAALWIATLPLWLTGFLAPLLPLLLSAYLNQRLFRYDALSDHASAEEMHALVRASRGRLYLLGFLLALLYYVPLLNLLVPILSALAFTYFALERLAGLRAAHAREAGLIPGNGAAQIKRR